jgi:hypothetical protein
VSRLCHGEEYDRMEVSLIYTRHLPQHTTIPTCDPHVMA